MSSSCPVDKALPPVPCLCILDEIYSIYHLMFIKSLLIYSFVSFISSNPNVKYAPCTEEVMYWWRLFGYLLAK